MRCLRTSGWCTPEIEQSLAVAVMAHHGFMRFCADEVVLLGVPESNAGHARPTAAITISPRPIGYSAISERKPRTKSGKVFYYSHRLHSTLGYLSPAEMDEKQLNPVHFFGGRSFPMQMLHFNL